MKIFDLSSSCRSWFVWLVHSRDLPHTKYFSHKSSVVSALQWYAFGEWDSVFEAHFSTACVKDPLTFSKLSLSGGSSWKFKFKGRNEKRPLFKRSTWQQYNSLRLILTRFLRSPTYSCSLQSIWEHIKASFANGKRVIHCVYRVSDTTLQSFCPPTNFLYCNNDFKYLIQARTESLDVFPGAGCNSTDLS